MKMFDKIKAIAKYLNPNDVVEFINYTDEEVSDWQKENRDFVMSTG